MNSFKNNKKKIYLIIFLMFIMNMGFYMLIPYLAFYLTESVKISSFIVGAILGVRLLCQQGMSFFGGILADRFGIRLNILIGTILRSFGFLLFGLSNSTLFLIIASILSGLGGALYTPAIKSALVYYSPSEEDKSKIFSILNISDNLAIALGPLFGLLLLGYDFLYIACISSIIYLISGIVSYLLVFESIENKLKTRNKFVNYIRVVIVNKPFMFLLIFTISFFLQRSRFIF